MKNIYLFVGNHGSLDGIDDYIQIFKQVFSSRGLNLEVTNKLIPNATNLILDEFSGMFENKRIVDFCNDSVDNRCIFVLTEFINCKFGVRSFNNFNGLSSSALISLINVCLRYLRSDLPNVGGKDVLQLLIFCPVLFALFFIELTNTIIFFFAVRNPNHSINKFNRKVNKLIYFHMRYLGLNSMIRYARGVILAHAAIKIESLNFNSKSKIENLGVLYPELDKEKILSADNSRKILIETTGTVTPYRHLWIKRFNRAIQIMGGSNTFKYCISYPFGIASKTAADLRGSYSLHPQQTATWPYCSPTRIYRALMVDRNIPILIKNTLQHEIEDVCLHVYPENFPNSKIENPISVQIYISKILKLIVKIYSQPIYRAELLGAKVDRYQAIARKNNNDLVEKIIN